MTGEAMEAAARAVLHRRIKPDFFEVKDGAWTIDHDKVIAEAAVTAYLAALPTAPAEMPGENDIHSLLLKAQRDFQAQRDAKLAGQGLWPDRSPAPLNVLAKVVAEYFAPILAEKERAEREWASEKERADMAVAQMVKQNGRMRELVALLDQQMGTPCEQIRHRQEVEALEARALAAEAALAAERERCARVVEDWAEMHAGHLSDDGPTPLGRHRVAMNDGYALAAAIRAEGE